MKKILAVFLVVLLSCFTLFAGGNKEAAATAPEATVAVNPEIGEAFAKTVNISLMNSKPEITDALEEGAALFGSAYNVNIEIVETDNPGLTIAQRYASGDAPTIAIVDSAQVKELAGQRIADLSSEPWVAVGGDVMGYKVDG